jgi:hypothetical protein
MSESHVISGLKVKQYEIRRRISELEDEIKVCRTDLVSISETLRIFGDPDAYVKPEALFSRGDLARTIFDALRGSLEGLDLHQLTEIVAKANNLDMDDAKLAPIVRTRVNNALYRYMNKGEVFNRKGRDGNRVWRLAP